MSSLVAALSRGLRPLSIRASVENWLGIPVDLQNGEFWRAWIGTGTFTGKRVTVDQALQLSTAWACVRRISGTIATLPCGFYQRKADGSREAATGHPLYDILHNQPNADMTAVVFWEVMVASMLLWGNAYAEIKRSAGRIVALQFLYPARMVMKRLANGAHEWRYVDPVRGTERVIAETDLMHVTAFSTDGVTGLSPIAYGANVFNTAMETDRASAETFRDSTRASGIITTDLILKGPQRDEIRAHVKKVGAEGGVYVLEKGTGFENLRFDPVSAELLSSRSFNVEEICRWYLMDPAMVGHGAKDSNWGTGLEQKMLWFITFTLREWCVRIEQQVRKSLLTPAERIKYYAEFNMEGLQRGDSAGRAAYYSTMTQNGVMNRNDARAKENLPPVEGGDVLTVQSNLIPLDQLGKVPAAADRTAANALLAWLGISPDAEKKE